MNGFEERIFPPGCRVSGRYRVLGVLGVGGMGVVYRAYDEVLDVELALKVLRPEIARDAGFVQRFHNELVLARKVSHRHVVSNYDVGIHEGLHFMTMDLVIGRPLDDVLRDRGQLSFAEALRIVRQVAEALAEAHRQGIVHRDLKPANILLDGDGNAYVTDFGIARSLGSGLTRTGEILGTPDYLSPEQARGEKVDGRSDIFTLGLIFIQLLTGKLPFPGGTLLEVVAQRMAGKMQSLDEIGFEAPPQVTRLIEKCTEKNPDKRFQSADEMVAELVEVESGGRKGGKSVKTLAWVAAASLALGFGAFYLVQTFVPPHAGGNDRVASPTSYEGQVPLPPPVVLPAPEPRHSVAVLPFYEVTGSLGLAWASNGVAEMLANALADDENLRVVESVRVFQILRDLGYESGRFTSDEVRQLGELLKVDRIVFGDLRSIEGRIRLEMSLMELDLPGSPTREIGDERGELRELFDLVDQLAENVGGALDARPTRISQTPLTPVAAAMQSYTEGLGHLSRRETLKAAPALEEAVGQDPDFVHAWVRLSQAYQSLGRFEEALDAAGRAVRATRETRGRIAYEARAQEALLRGEPGEAQRFLEELVRRYPNDTGARIALAEAYGLQGRFNDAVARLEEVVEVDPGDGRAWYLLGRYSIQNGDSQRAVDDYLVQALVQQKKLRNEQGEAEVENALGAGYEMLGRVDEAKENYEAAAEIRRRIGDRRGLATTLTNLVRVHLSRGDYELAETSLLTALDIHKELGNQAGIAELYTAYGILEEERGRYEEALGYYRQGLKERTNLGDESALAESHGNVGYSYYLLGEYDNALLYLEKALALYRKNEDQRGVMLTLQSVGFCQLAQGTWNDSLESFVESLEISREFGEKLATSVSLGNLGLLAQYQGRLAAALDSYEDTLAILVELGDARGQAEFTLHRVEALLELGQLGRAELELGRLEDRQAAGGNREHRAALLTLRGHALLGQGQAREASELFREAATEAAASQSAGAQLKARIGSGLAALEAGEAGRAAEELAPAASEADRLGNAILRLHAGEALARAELLLGRLDRAEDLLRKALRTSSEGGSYVRAYRLHQLLAEVLEQKGEAGASAQSLAKARDELDRVRQNLGEDLRRHFDELPEVRELL